MTYKWLGALWFYDIPARDLTDAEYSNLTPEQQAQVAQSHKHIVQRVKQVAPAPVSTPETEPAKEL